MASLVKRETRIGCVFHVLNSAFEAFPGQGL